MLNVRSSILEKLQILRTPGSDPSAHVIGRPLVRHPALPNPPVARFVLDRTCVHLDYSVTQLLHTLVCATCVSFHRARQAAVGVRRVAPEPLFKIRSL